MDFNAYLQTLKNRCVPKEYPFSVSEYKERVAKVRKEMESAGVDFLLVTNPANLYYLAGYYTFEVSMHTALLLPLNGEPMMQAPSVEVAPALLNGWIDDIVGYNFYQTGQICGQIMDFITKNRLQDKNLGVEGQLAGLKNQLYQELRKALPKANFIDASDVVMQVKIVKSPKEIQFLREAGRITNEGIKASLQAIAPGVTDNAVARLGFDAMVGAGSEFFSMQPVVTTGHRAGWIHTNFRRVPLKAGDVVFIEYGAAYQRYTAPMMRTAYIGKPPSQVLEISRAVKDTVQALLESIKSGRTIHEVAVEAHKAWRPVEDQVFFSGVYGYTVGAQFPPTWIEGSGYIAEGINRPLEAGMVFHLPICFRVPGQLGIGLSETIVITESGCDILTQRERDLYMAPA